MRRNSGAGDCLVDHELRDRICGEQLAMGEVRCRHPLAPRAALHGLKASGAAGREALERVGRNQPDLRGDIRSLLGGTR